VGRRFTDGRLRRIPPAVSGSLRADLGGGRVLTVTWDAALTPLTGPEVLRFAEGITYHG
jgi:hypothetical protein